MSGKETIKSSCGLRTRMGKRGLSKNEVPFPSLRAVSTMEAIWSSEAGGEERVETGTDAVRGMGVETLKSDITSSGKKK